MARRSKRAAKVKKADKYAKQKMLAIPALLLVLVYVLITNLAGGGDASATITASTPKPTAVQPTRPGSINLDVTKSLVTKAWPLPSLGFLDGPSPLSSFREPIGKASNQGEVFVAGENVEQSSQRIEADIREQLASQPTQFVFKSSTRRIALVGDQIVSEGEQLQSGARLRDVRGKNLLIEVSRRVD